MNRLMIRDPEDFIGRTVEIEKVFSRLGAARPQSVSIVGERRIGKSSLLYHLSLPDVRAKYLKDGDRFVFVFVDLHGLVGIDVPEFFELLLDEISSASGIPRPAAASTGYLTMKRYLQELERQKRKLVILWDEFDAITRNPNFGAEVFSFFRSVANRYDVAYVTTAARELQDLCHTEAIAVSPFFNIFTNLYLRAFSPEEARELIRAPSESAGVPLQGYEPFLLDIAGYFPFFLQVACNSLFDQIAAGLSREKAEDRAKAQFTEEAAPHFRYLWQHLAPESKEVLRSIAHGLSPMTRQTYAEERLMREGYLVSSKEGYRVFSSVFAHHVEEFDRTTSLNTAPTPMPGEGAKRPSPLKRFTVIRDLGAGGMSTVALAHDNLLDQDVALKILHRDLYNQPGMLLRFRRETALARELHHANICPVFDLVEEEGRYYIAMKYIDGVTLKSRIREGPPLTLKEIIDFGRQILRGLAAAHCVVVHRDLKPQNIMLDRAGKVFLLDFGLARTPSDPSVTLAGTVMGTPGYMSPEQIEGRTVDHRSDLYALGVIFFEMATGQQPFVADDIDRLLVKHRTEPAPSILQARPDLPAELDAIVRRLLAKKAIERFETAHAVLQALEELAVQQGLERKPGDITTKSFRRPEIAG
jgi:serine/threonine-protein kinase